MLMQYESNLVSIKLYPMGSKYLQFWKQNLFLNYFIALSYPNLKWVKNTWQVEYTWSLKKSN